MRILVADDQLRVRSALHLLFEQEPDLNVVGDASEAEGLLMQAEATCPDLVLLDWELPGLKPDQIVSALRAICPEVTVIALSVLPEARDAAISARVDAFVSKGEPPELLLETVNRYRRGRADEPSFTPEERAPCQQDRGRNGAGGAK